MELNEIFKNENEKPQPIDNQLRVCFRVPRTRIDL